jgi:hypothetical protein
MRIVGILTAFVFPTAAIFYRAVLSGISLIFHFRHEQGEPCKIRLYPPFMICKVFFFRAKGDSPTEREDWQTTTSRAVGVQLN